MVSKLIPVQGGNALPLTPRVTVVGRREHTCNICFDDLRVSRVHCVIRETDDGGFELRDLGSTNGTRVNGHRVTECLLMNNDELSFAKERYRITLESDDAGESGEAADRDEGSSVADSVLDSDDEPLTRAGTNASGEFNRTKIKLTKSKLRNLGAALLDDEKPA